MRVRPTPHGGGSGAPHCTQLFGGVTEMVFTPAASAEADASGHVGGQSVPDDSRSRECKGCVPVKRPGVVGVEGRRSGSEHVTARLLHAASPDLESHHFK